ncbi:MAG: hypothetical protein JJV98_12750 [Desulfosarcina sp.]|nr:hypothetical protein [Desulfobacterales bacterium]
MAEPLADQVVRKIKQASELYHRLMLVVAPSGAGKTTALQDVKKRVGAPLINAANVLDQLDDRLDTLIFDWTAAFISNLEDPTTKSNLDLLKPEPKKMVNGFIRKLTNLQQSL